MPQVLIEKGEEPFDSTLRILEKLNLREIVEGKENILIKPNLVTASSPEMGITTDMRVVEAILHHLEDVKASIIIGEGSGGCPTEIAFRRNRYNELTRRYRVKLLDLNKDDAVKVRVAKPLSISELKVSRTAYKSDFRISVGKLKIHSIGIVTACLKNMMGALSGRRWKLIVHAKVHKRIVDLNKIILPHFGIVDGIVGNEIDEIVSNPVQMNVVIAGRDAVSVDSVSAECIGVDWRDVQYLVLAEREHLGIADIERIDVVGHRIEEVKRKFRRNRTLWAIVRTGSERVYGYLLGHTLTGRT